MIKTFAIIIIPETPSDFGGYHVAIKSILRIYETIFDQLLIFCCTENKIGDFCFMEKKHKIVFCGVSNQKIYIRFLKSILSFIPATSIRYKISFKLISNYLSKNQINATHVVFEDIPLTFWVKQIKKLQPQAKIITRSHDIMSHAYRKLSIDNNIFLRCCWKLELMKIRSVEITSYLSSDIFVTISQDDLNSYKSEFGNTNSCIFSIGVSFDVSKYSYIPVGDINNIICIGTFDDRKSRGLFNFLDISWPLIRKNSKKAKLILAGKGSEKFTSKSNNVIGLGWVKDDLDVLSLGLCFINPQNEGSGIQIKSLIALASGRKLFSLSLGLSGLPHDVKKYATECKDYQSFGIEISNFILSNNFNSSLQLAWCKQFDYRFFTQNHSSLFQKKLHSLNTNS